MLYMGFESLTSEISFTSSEDRTYGIAIIRYCCNVDQIFSLEQLNQLFECENMA